MDKFREQANCYWQYKLATAFVTLSGLGGLGVALEE